MVRLVISFSRLDFRARLSLSSELLHIAVRLRMLMLIKRYESNRGRRFSLYPVALASVRSHVLLTATRKLSAKSDGWAITTYFSVLNCGIRYLQKDDRVKCKGPGVIAAIRPSAERRGLNV